jgi:hypothetical protein
VSFSEFVQTFIENIDQRQKMPREGMWRHENSIIDQDEVRKHMEFDVLISILSRMVFSKG